MFETIVYTDRPQILQALPDTVDVTLHQPVELKVKFDSPTESDVVWTANGAILESSPKYQILTTSKETTLQIADVLKDDTEMVYKCEVKNVSGQVGTSTSLVMPCK